MSNPINPTRFAGKFAIVTAAASGIGKATVQRLLSEGATVHASDKDIDALTLAFADRTPSTGELILDALDVSNYDRVVEYFNAYRNVRDHLDILVNNAGMASWGSAENLAVERWHAVIAVTLDSVFYLTKAAVPLLRNSTAGAIVNTASISGLVGDNGLLAYNAAKAGVINLTRSVAVDHAPDGIRANAVCPGLTDTPRVKWMDANPEISMGYSSRIPAKRKGRPEEIAAAIAFLASEDASYITGVALPVDGGMTAFVQPPFLQLLPDRVS